MHGMGKELAGYDKEADPSTRDSLSPAVQSKIAELDERNAELMKEVKRLHQENQNLDARTQALVRLVHQKNAQLDQMKETVRGLPTPVSVG